MAKKTPIKAEVKEEEVKQVIPEIIEKDTSEEDYKNKMIKYFDSHGISWTYKNGKFVTHWTPEGWANRNFEKAHLNISCPESQKPTTKGRL